MARARDGWFAAVLVGTMTARAADAGDTATLDADAWCTAHPGEVLVGDADKLWHRLDQNRPRTDPGGHMAQAWTGDLDGDGRADLVLEHAAGCGSKECMFEAFVARRDGTYASVMAPDDGDSVRVVKGGKRGRQRIELRHVGEAKSPKARDVWSTARFTADGYR
jgi:hypothetical protein